MYRLCHDSRLGLAAAEARHEQATLNVERATVSVPFDARIKLAAVEVDQYVTPGVPILTLADDSLLEISVPLDSQEARQWLLFEEKKEGDTAWFGKLKPVECEVRWTDDDSYAWTGKLHRVERFDERSRTLTVAVRLTSADTAAPRPDALPLVDAMFCEVRIPGKTIPGVYCVPRSAVSFDGTVYVAVENRLKTVPVEIVHEQEDAALIQAGLQPGDLIITTRLVNPQENALLTVEMEAGEDGGS